MSARLNLSSEVAQWFINLINNLDEIYRRFDAVYRKALLPLLASFTEICGGIWRVELITSVVYGDEYHYYFKCGKEQYFRVPVGYRTHEKIFFKEARKNPIAAYLLNKAKEAETEESKRRIDFRAIPFTLQLSADLLVYHDYAFPIGKIGGHYYDLCHIYVMESMYGVPIIEFSDLCIRVYTYEVSIRPINEGLGVTWYKNEKDPDLPPADLLSAVYEKRDEIERRVNPTLKVLDEVIKGAVSILLY